MLRLAFGSTLLLSTSPFKTLKISLVRLSLAFNPLLSNALFHFKTFSFKFSLGCFHSLKLYKISLINPFLAFSVIIFTVIEKAAATGHILDVHQIASKLLQKTVIQFYFRLWFVIDANHRSYKRKIIFLRQEPQVSNEFMFDCEMLVTPNIKMFELFARILRCNFLLV